MSFCGKFIDRQAGSCKKQLLQLLIFQDCLCHCCLIVGCFCVVGLLFLSLVVWSSCDFRSERGPAVPQLLVSTSTAQLPLTHPSTHTVCQPKRLPGRNTTAVDLLPPLLTQSSSPPFTAQPWPPTRPPTSTSAHPPPSQHRSTGAQLSVRAALRPATAGV